MKIEISNKIKDQRINAVNYTFIMKIGDFYDMVKDILNENEYQRRRVKNSKTIYKLLKEDLAKGCIMPPIVLAFKKEINDENKLWNEINESKENLVILDGLQRSYTIKELISDYNNGEYTNYDCNPLDNPIRVELYVGINRLGILYRMLTLNTGQTQMSTRHQIEIIYSDYKNNCTLPNVKLIAEVDNVTPNNIGEYKFRDVVDGFTSYMQKDYMTLDRMDILDNVQNLQRLSSNADKEDDLFYAFLDSYNKFVVKMDTILKVNYDANSLKEELEMTRAPFATSVVKMFNKSQPLTGFGNAISTLREFKALTDFGELRDIIINIHDGEIEKGFKTIIKHLDNISNIAKKIGNDQRLYFYYFFKALFDRYNDAYLDILQSAKFAYSQYERITQ